MTTTPAVRDILFVSHANPEDNDFALWVALRLAAEGYAVWCDMTELLGGEDFWKDIQKVLETRAVKFLFVTSKTSTAKEGALQELTVAKRVAQANNLSDFVIPLHVDDSDTNIEISRLNYIPFNKSWAAGLAQLLKKLEKEKIPKSDIFGPPAVSEWWKQHFSSDAGLLHEPETLYSNWFPISPYPEKIFLHTFQPGYTRSLLLSGSVALPPTRQHANAILTFAPLSDFPNSSSIFWNSSAYRTDDLLNDQHKGALVDAKTFTDVLADLFRQAWEQCLTDAGLLLYQLASGDQCGYFVKDLLKNDWASFDVDGFKGRRQVVGFKTTNKEKQTLRHWHFGISGRFFLRHRRHLAINLHVLFSDDGKTIWTSSDRMHRAKMSQCSNWWNHHWRDRLFGTMAFLAKDGTVTLQLAENETLEIPLQPITFTSPVKFYDPVGPEESNEDAEPESDEGFDLEDQEEWD